MKKKMVSVLCVAMAMCMILTACGQKGKTDPEGGSSKTKPEYVLKVAYVHNADDPASQGCLEFERLVEERTNGAIDVQVYLDGLLGDTGDIVEQTKHTPAFACITDASRFEGSVPEIAYLNAPYAFKDFDEGLKVVQSDAAQKLYDKLEEVDGVKVLSFNYWQGERHFVTMKDVRTVSDFNGMLVRSPGTALYDGLIESLGASPTSLPWNDIYNAMQTKVVEGCEGTTAGLYTSNLDEVGKSLIKTGHIQMFTGMIINAEWFNSLPEEYQDALMTSSIDAGTFCNDFAHKTAAQYMDEMSKTMNICEVDTNEFKEAVSKMYDKFPEYDQVRADIAGIL